MESDLSGVPCLALPFVSFFRGRSGIPVCSGGRVAVKASSPFSVFFLWPFLGASIPRLCLSGHRDGFFPTLGCLAIWFFARHVWSQSFRASLAWLCLLSRFRGRSGIPVCTGGRIVVAASSPFSVFFLFLGASIPHLAAALFLFCYAIMCPVVFNAALFCPDVFWFGKGHNFFFVSVPLPFCQSYLLIFRSVC